MRIMIVAILLFQISANSITCGEAGTFSYPYEMTYASVDGSFPPCAWCDSAAGKWSNEYIPTTGGTRCACQNGRYFVQGVDGSSTSFTCPLCPFGTYKNGVNLIETCTDITLDTDSQYNTTSDTPSTAENVPHLVSEITVETNTTNDFSFYVTACIVVSSMVIVTVVFITIKRHNAGTCHMNKDLEAPLYDTKSALHDTTNFKINTGPGDGVLFETTGEDPNLVEIVKTTPVCI
jgi:hypothetical protein